MQKLHRASKIFYIQSRLFMDSSRDPRYLQQTWPANNGRIEANNHFYSYTSGRWLYNEQQQLEKRYVKFDVPALQHTASHIVGSRCIQMTKIPEGMYNKVFSLKMENSREVLARIPNPNAGNSQYVVASEVATLDFVRDATCSLFNSLC